MSIIRSPRCESNFYVLDKQISEDKRLGWVARGLLVFLFSMQSKTCTTDPNRAGRNCSRSGQGQAATGHLAGVTQEELRAAEIDRMVA